MAYAEIRFGEDAGLYIDGIKSSGYEPERDHLTMEDWSHHAGRNWSEFEWVEASTWTAQTFRSLGSDMVVYQTRYGIDDSDNVKRWVYACGDVKERVERDFDEIVAPTIIRDVPQALPERKTLRAHALIDPRVDRVTWPRWPDREIPPAIELRRGTAKTMPIEAHMPPTNARGSANFMCRMRYGSNGLLKKAECTILRRPQWRVIVTVSPAGFPKVTSKEYSY